MIYRNGEEVANLTGTNTHYIDYPPTYGWYSYQVSYYNSTGEGPRGDAVPELVCCGIPEFRHIPFNWVEINNIGVNTGINEDDQNLGPFPIGFDFPWYDNMTYNSIRVCSNGFLSFTSTSTDNSNDPIPSVSEPNNFIAPYWDDFHPGYGACWYYHDAVNNRFIIEYEHFIQSGVYNSDFVFETILYPNGLIDFMYHTLNGNLNSCTVGIENYESTVGIQTTYNGSGPMEPFPQSGIRTSAFPFILNFPSITLTPHNPPIRIPAGGGSFSLEIEVANIGLDFIWIDCWTKVVLPNGAVIAPLALREGVRLAPGQTLSRVFTQYVPHYAPSGDYTYIAEVGMYPYRVDDRDSFPLQNSPATRRHITTLASGCKENSFWNSARLLSSLYCFFSPVVSSKTQATEYCL